MCCNRSIVISWPCRDAVGIFWKPTFYPNHRARTPHPGDGPDPLLGPRIFRALRLLGSILKRFGGALGSILKRFGGRLARYANIDPTYTRTPHSTCRHLVLQGIVSPSSRTFCTIHI